MAAGTHLYQIYEVSANGEEHHTGKTVECPPPAGGGECQVAITKPLLKIYGFSQYETYYYVRAASSTKDRIVIYYNYHEGSKDTWILKRGR